MGGNVEALRVVRSNFNDTLYHRIDGIKWAPLMMLLIVGSLTGLGPADG